MDLLYVVYIIYIDMNIQIRAQKLANLHSISFCLSGESVPWPGGPGRRVYLSRHAGHLVRTKAQGVDEGGVAAGYAVISSPYLTG